MAVPRAKLLDMHNWGGQKNLQAESRWFLDFWGLGDQKTVVGAALSTVNYRDMGHGMGQRGSQEILSNFLGSKQKKKS